MCADEESEGRSYHSIFHAFEEAESMYVSKTGRGQCEKESGRKRYCVAPEKVCIMNVVEGWGKTGNTGIR